METSLSKCAELVWKFRQQNGELDRLDSLRCAYSEMGAAYSEFTNGELEVELADCAIMLITAIGKGARDYTRFRVPDYIRSMRDERNLDYVAMEVALALSHAVTGGNGRLNMMLALSSIEFLLDRREASLEDLIGRKLQAKIEAGDG